MPLGPAEQAQDLFGGRMGALTLLGIQREFRDVLALHGETEFALDECADEKREEVQSEECLDAALVLEEDGGAISCTVLICSKRFSIIGWPLWAWRISAADRARSFVIKGYMPSLLWS